MEYLYVKLDRFFEKNPAEIKPTEEKKYSAVKSKFTDSVGSNPGFPSVILSLSVSTIL